MIEASWGSRPPLTVGVEEEVMILDAETLDQVGAVDVLLRETDGVPLPGALKTELHASVFELTTEPTLSPHEAGERVVELRRVAAAAAGRNGLAIAAAGTHPFALPERQPIVDEARYTDFVGYAGVSARRQGVNGLHVHVAMPDASSCHRAMEAILPWLPLVLALSANSPWLGGERTGLASNRAVVLAELPRSGAPPEFASYEEWEAFVERFARLGLAADHTRFWWDVRPHPRFGTLEIRMPDQPTSARMVAAFTALVQGLCGAALSGRLDPGRRAGGRGEYQQNRWAAARFGPRAELVHPDGDRLATVPALAEELLARLETRGVDDLLDVIDAQACEGDLQQGEPRAVAADLVRRTLG